LGLFKYGFELVGQRSALFLVLILQLLILTQTLLQVLFFDL
jgi:hypothetical protein